MFVELYHISEKKKKTEGLNAFSLNRELTDQQVDRKQGFLLKTSDSSSKKVSLRIFPFLANTQV